MVRFSTREDYSSNRTISVYFVLVSNCHIFEGTGSVRLQDFCFSWLKSQKCHETFF